MQKEINDSADSIEITQDYAYDNLTDYNFSDGIHINKSNFTINGNGHTIDGLGKSRIFNIIGKNITILNLNLINGHAKEKGGAILASNSIKLTNMTFYNNSAENGGTAYLNDTCTITNCEFANCYAKDGAALYLKSPAEIYKSIFKNSKADSYSLIFGKEKSPLTIEECIFLDSTAIMNHNNTKIRNSTFRNLHSQESGGAVALKETKKATFENCLFENTSAVKNGGALYLDIGGSECYDGDVEIINTTFYNSFGDFGGALVQLGGNLTINNSIFSENNAIYAGGAIYASYTNITMKNVSVLKNTIVEAENFNGGGMYIDYSILSLTDSIIANNTNNGVYLYESKGLIKDTLIVNNTEAIHAVFNDNLKIDNLR